MHVNNHWAGHFSCAVLWTVTISRLRNCTRHPLFLLWVCLVPFGLSAFLIYALDFCFCFSTKISACLLVSLLFGFLVFDSSSPFDYYFACWSLLRFSDYLVMNLAWNKQHSLQLPWSASASLFRRNIDRNDTLSCVTPIFAFLIWLIQYNFSSSKNQQRACFWGHDWKAF